MTAFLAVLAALSAIEAGGRLAAGDVPFAAFFLLTAVTLALHAYREDEMRRRGWGR